MPPWTMNQPAIDGMPVTDKIKGWPEKKIPGPKPFEMKGLERVKRLELSTSSLARKCSTN